MRPKRAAHRALIVDDDLATRLLAGFELRAAGFEVEEAADGAEALVRLRARPADLVVLDVHMPGLDGFETCAEIRADPQLASLAVLMATSSDDVDAVERAFEVGATDFVTKPLQGALLRHRAKFLVRARDALAALQRSTADLVASEPRLAEAQRLAQIGHWEWDVDADQVFWSEQLIRILDLDPTEPPTIAALVAAVAPEQRVALEKALERVRVDGGGFELAHDVLRRDGGTRSVDHQAETAQRGPEQRRCISGTVQDVTERRSSEEQIRRLAYYDSLTGLPNRVLFGRKLAGLLRYARSSGRLVGLLFIDVDRFKFVNDTLGHSTGDELLRAIAERLVESLRLGDDLARAGGESAGSGSVCRMGGDEFIVTVLVRDRPEDVTLVAERLVAALSRPFAIRGEEVAVSASIGVSIFPRDAEDSETLMRHADVAMYQAKRSGRDRFEVYTRSVDDSVARSLGLRSELRAALDQGQFLLHYQPLIEHGGRVVSFEALLRWRHPVHGMLSPAFFVPLAEESGAIAALGEWALETACRECAGWQAQTDAPLAVAVNLSAHQIRLREFRAVVERALAQSGLPANRLELELTESILLMDTERAVETLAELRAMGVHLSLDDFGTGYSSLSYLKRLPMHSVKIDRSFVRDLATDVDDSAIVAAIVDVARRLRLRVVAEGVEGPEQEQILRGLGCDVMQGYHFARPMPAEQVLPFLERWGRRARTR